MRQSWTSASTTDRTRVSSATASSAVGHGLVLPEAFARPRFPGRAVQPCRPPAEAPPAGTRSATRRPLTRPRERSDSDDSTTSAARASDRMWGTAGSTSNSASVPSKSDSSTSRVPRGRAPNARCTSTSTPLMLDRAARAPRSTLVEIGRRDYGTVSGQCCRTRRASRRRPSAARAGRAAAPPAPSPARCDRRRRPARRRRSR